MGWGIIVKKELFLPRMRIDELKEKLEEVRDDIMRVERELLLLCACENIDYDRETYEDRYDYVLRRFDEIIDDLKELWLEEYLIELALSEDAELEEY